MDSLPRLEVGDSVIIKDELYRFMAQLPATTPQPGAPYELRFDTVRHSRPLILTAQGFYDLYVEGQIKLLRPGAIEDDQIAPDESEKNALARRKRVFWTEIFDAHGHSNSI